MKENLHICCCYAHTDRPLLEGLKRFLLPLQRAGLITIWTDADISPGSDWEKEIRHHLQIAQIILLLVSPDFLNSDYCSSKEMQYALERHHNKQARAIPIILRPSLWMYTALANLQALPKYAVPIVSEGRSQDEAFLDIAEGLRLVIEELSFNVQKPLFSGTLTETAIAYGNVPRAVANAVLALDSVDQEQRYQGLYALQLMTHPVAQEALVSALHHPIRDVRMEAALLLRRDRRAIPTLVEMLYPYDDTPFYYRGVRDRSDFENEAIRRRELAIDALCQMGEPAIPALMEALDNNDNAVRAKAVEALGQLTVMQAVPGIVGRLVDPDYEVRKAAAEALSLLAVPALTKNAFFYKQDEEVRLAFIKALGTLQDSQVVPPLIDALHKEEKHQVRLAIIEALGMSQDQQAIPALTYLLNEQDEEVRVAVRDAFHTLLTTRLDEHKEEVYALLTEALNEQDGEVRGAAVKVLDSYVALYKEGKRQVPLLIIKAWDLQLDYTISALTYLFNEQDEEVRGAARDAFHTLLTTWLDEQEEVYALLTEALDEQDGEVRVVVRDVFHTWLDKHKEEVYALLAEALDEEARVAVRDALRALQDQSE